MEKRNQGGNQLTQVHLNVASRMVHVCWCSPKSYSVLHVPLFQQRSELSRTHFYRREKNADTLHKVRWNFSSGRYHALRLCLSGGRLSWLNCQLSSAR